MKSKIIFTAVLIVMGAGYVVAAQDRVLFSFESPASAQPWQSVNDGVMGGRSDGRFRINEDKKMEFFGTLSLANNGGFASVRASASTREGSNSTRAGNLGLNPGDVIVARVRGDGREYNFDLYAGRDLGGYAYRQTFETKKDEWIEVELPVDESVANWRGKLFPNQKLDPTKVTGLGFLLGDKKPGAFKLEVEWIKVRKPLAETDGKINASGEGPCSITEFNIFG